MVASAATPRDEVGRIDLVQRVGRRMMNVEVVTEVDCQPQPRHAAALELVDVLTGEGQDDAPAPIGFSKPAKARASALQAGTPSVTNPSGAPIPRRTRWHPAVGELDIGRLLRGAAPPQYFGVEARTSARRQADTDEVGQHSIHRHASRRPAPSDDVPGVEMRGQHHDLVGLPTAADLGDTLEETTRGASGREGRGAPSPCLLGRPGGQSASRARPSARPPGLRSCLCTYRCAERRGRAR